MSINDITAIILAGGQGQRMQGADKGWVDYQGRALIVRVLERARLQSADVIISCNRNLERYRTLGHSIVSDQREGYCGPLAGIEAGLGLCHTRLALILPCDAPHLPSTLAESLLNVQDEQTSPITYARDLEREHYLFALWRTDLLPALKAFIDSGGRAVRDFYQAQGASSCVISEPRHAFDNINHTDDLK